MAAFPVIEPVAAIVAPIRLMLVAGSVSWLLFIAYVTWCVLRNVLKQKEITTETIYVDLGLPTPGTCLGTFVHFAFSDAAERL